MQVLFVTHFDPSPVGHGGVHRTYQVFQDLEAVAGQGNVTIVKVWLQWWKPYPIPAPPPAADSGSRVQRVTRRLITPATYVRRARRLRESIARRAKKTARTLDIYRENPLKLLAQTDYNTQSCRDPYFLRQYEETVKRTRPSVCVLEHTSFADVIPINRRYGIQTICCPQNLEAFDLMGLDSKWSRATAAQDFANEIRVLSECDVRLFISQVETAVVKGLGLDSKFYPYLPVGEIREQHLKIRQERASSKLEPGLFVMLGSTEHDTTREGFLWFLQTAQQYGLPRGARVVIGGSGTQYLMPQGTAIPGIELCGWLEPAALQSLLLHTQAMLIPQHRGFGALTRLPEFACAGIPVVVSRHPTYALDLPPGAFVAEDDWQAWYSQMEAIMAKPRSISSEEYADWEAHQPRTLNTQLRERVQM